MAEARIYECPMCKGNFTTIQIKKNEKKCPSCSVPLRHDIDSSAGSMVHRWIVDEDVVLTIETPRDEKKAKFEKISRRGERPEVYKLIGKPKRELDPTYRVVYMDRYGSTNLRCPACHSYLHTSNSISGSRQNTLCRTKNDKGGKWEKCGTRTEFCFFKQGETFDAIND